MKLRASFLAFISTCILCPSVSQADDATFRTYLSATDLNQQASALPSHHPSPEPTIEEEEYPSVSEIEAQVDQIESSMGMCIAAYDPCSASSGGDPEACASGAAIAGDFFISFMPPQITLDDCRASCLDLEEKIRAAKAASPCRSFCALRYPGADLATRAKRRTCEVTCLAAISKTMRTFCYTCHNLYPVEIPRPKEAGEE